MENIKLLVRRIDNDWKRIRKKLREIREYFEGWVNFEKIEPEYLVLIYELWDENKEGK